MDFLKEIGQMVGGNQNYNQGQGGYGGQGQSQGGYGSGYGGGQGQGQGRGAPPNVPRPWYAEWDDRENRWVFINEENGRRTHEYPGGYGQEASEWAGRKVTYRPADREG